jgi:hypothetical protein
MSHKVCHDVGEWEKDNVSQQLEKCIKRHCIWWCLCCNKWFCGLVWVVMTVLTWVVKSVCEIVADFFDAIVASFIGLWNIIVGIITWNWTRVWDALVGIVYQSIHLAVDIFRVITLGDLVGFVRDRVDAWRLRDYVESLIDSPRTGYSQEDRARIKAALGISDGGFGLRLKVRAMRGYVTSDQVTHGPLPDLVTWHNDTGADTHIDLKVLTGFASTTFWQRGRPELVPANISEADINAYLANPATQQFTVYCMSSGVLDEKLSAAVIKASTIGLKLRFDTEDVQLTEANQVRVVPDPMQVPAVLHGPPFNRTFGAANAAVAKAELCSPLSVGTFLFTDNSYTGYSSVLKTSFCLEGMPIPGEDLTGTFHRDRLPDFVFLWVPIHEIGHTFGLCHVAGLDRIMYSAKEKSIWSWSLIPEYLWLSGEPRYTYEEAQRVWTYIIDNFSVQCLAQRQF